MSPCLARSLFDDFRSLGLVLRSLPYRRMPPTTSRQKRRLCAACHGQNGVPADPKTMPIIWGQQQSYLVKQLHDYRSGDRDNPIMSPIAKGLAQEDLRKIAAYFAAKSWPAQHGAAASASPPDGIAQCQPCHQPKFEGGPPAPRLAGLSYEYLVAAMRQLRHR